MLSGCSVGERLLSGSMAALGLADPHEAPSKTKIRLGIVQILEMGAYKALVGLNHVFWDPLAGGRRGCSNMEGLTESMPGEIPDKVKTEFGQKLGMSDGVGRRSILRCF